MCSPFTERGALCIECSSSTTSDRNESPKIEKELGKKPLRVAVHFFAQVGTDYSALCSAVSEALKGLNTTESRLNELHHSMCFCVLKCGCVWSECWWKYLANEAATAIRNRDNLQFCTSFICQCHCQFCCSPLGPLFRRARRHCM